MCQSFRKKLESYAKRTYHVEAERLPFNNEDYAVFRHINSGKWFAVFIVKTRREFGLEGDGDTEVVSLKIRDRLLSDMLMKQPGYLRGYPSSKWNWTTIVLDGTVPFEDICKWLDESYDATKSKTKNKRVPLQKRRT